MSVEENKAVIRHIYDEIFQRRGDSDETICQKCLSAAWWNNLRWLGSSANPSITRPLLVIPSSSLDDCASRD